MTLPNPSASPALSVVPLSDKDLPPGQQDPRWSTVPRGDFTDRDDALMLSEGYGLKADPWQALVMDACLSHSIVDGRDLWTCRQVCVSVPRQNGKNAIVEMRELFGVLAFGERILHTSHAVSTSRKAFLRMLHFFDNPTYPELMDCVHYCRKSNGQEAIYLKNGGSIEFSARAKNTGRGFSVDVIIFDEAQHLSEESNEALLPTISAAQNPQTIYIGTPPGPMVHGDLFARLRKAAQDNVNPKMAWFEWSVDENDKGRRLDDPMLWAQANPALGYRITLDSILGERAAFSEEGFERERLGIWHDYLAMSTVLDMAKWEALGDRKSGIKTTKNLVIAVDVPPRRDGASIALCGEALKDKGLPHCELVPPMPGQGMQWALPWIIDRAKKWRAPVIIDSASPAGTFIPTLKAEGITVHAGNVHDMGMACGMLWDAVESGTLRHLGQQGVDTALRGARRRNLGDGNWGWHRRYSDVDISPLVSFTLAHYFWRIREAERASSRKQIVSLS